jgi:hypothetical protein
MPTYTLTLQPGPGVARDTDLASSLPNANSEGQHVVGAGESNLAVSTERALLKFDLSALPAGAQIVSAVLSLYLQSNQADLARIFRVFRQKRAWVSDQATWNNWATLQPWQTAGGFGANDCEQTDIGSLSVPAADAPGTAHAFTLTAAKVQEWLSGAFANNGLLLKADTETDDLHFWWSGDTVAVPALRPKLVITYTLGEASALGDQPGYDLTLEDGVNPPLGLLAGGAGGPAPGAIRRLPRGPGVERKAVQANEWTGGRGNARHATDQSRFYDSAFAWTMTPGQVLPAPLARFGNGPAGNLRRYGTWPGDLDAGRNPITTMRWVTLMGGTRFVADDFTAIASFTQIFAVRLIVRRVGAPAGPLIMSLRADSAGTPGAVVASGELPYGAFPEYASAYVYDWLSRVFPFKFPSTQTIVAGTKYWISIGDKNGTGTASDHWEVLWGLMVSGSAPTAYQSTDGTAWSGVTGDKPALCMRITNSIQGGSQTGNDDIKRYFFEYQRQLYLASTTQVLRNGDRGVCTGTQAAAKIVDTTKAWTTDEWAGCVAQVTSGAMKGQARKITSNTATELILQGSWPSTPAVGASGTEYAILGSDTWTAVAGITLNGNVSDIPAVMNGIVYAPSGGAAVMKRFREYNNAGVWTVEAADDGTNPCDFLEVFQEGEKVYLYNASSTLAKWNRAEQVAWPTNLTFEAAKPVGDAGTLVTGMTVYDDSVYIAKEDALYVVKNAIATLVPVPINTARDLNNGVGVRGWNTQLYFPFLDGFERLFGRTVDDIGPNRQEGLPPSRRGRVADFLPVLQYGFLAWDAGWENVESQTKGRFSALLATTAPGGDWHELYRPDWKSRRILSLFYQSLPLIANKLWFGECDEIMYLVMPNSAQNPLNDDQMLYTWEGAVTTAWVDQDSPELDHYFDELRLFTRNLTTVNPRRWVEVDYQVDAAGDASAWLRFPVDATSSPYQLLAVGDGNVTGRRIRFRLRLLTEDAKTPAVLNEWEARLNTMNEVLYDYVIDLRLLEKPMLLSGGESAAHVQSVIAQLQAWQEDATPLTMRSKYPAFDNVRGHIDPVSIVPEKWNAEEKSYQGSLTFKQT